MRMPRRTHRGWPEHYPIVHPWSEVRYCPTCWHTKLLSLGIPYVSYAQVHNWNLLTGVRRSVLNRLRRGLPHWSSEYQIKPLSFLLIQYSPFSLIAPPDLQLCQPFDHLTKPHGTSIIRKGPYHERIPTTRPLPIAYLAKHSILSLCFFHRGKQGGLVRVLLVQLGFHQTPIPKCTVMA
jgi:hypothetical protein